MRGFRGEEGRFEGRMRRKRRVLRVRVRSKSVQSSVGRLDSDAHTNKVLRGVRVGRLDSG